MTATPPGGGALTWRIKDSLLRYIQVIARGSARVSDGAELSEDGAFTFPLRNVERDDDRWLFTFAGEARLVAHHGMLDIRIAAPQLLIGPDSGLLSAQSGEDLRRRPIAATPGREVDPAQPVIEELPATLLEQAVELFGTVYAAGAELSALNVTVSLHS